MSSSTEAVILGREFQLVGSYHFHNQLKCVAPLGTDSVAVHYTAGSEHITSVHPTLTPQTHSPNRVSSEKTVLHMLFVSKYRVYVMFCADLTLRVLSDTFQHLQTIPTTTTALSMEFVEASSTLYVGESGCIKAWKLRHQLHRPLLPLTDSTVSVNKHQWVTWLDYEPATRTLTATTEHSAIIIDTNSHQQIATYSTEHTATSTSAISISSFGYLVIAFKDGSIKVLNMVLNVLVQELSGHLKAVTALKRHTMGSNFLSCSLDGTVRVWDLETLAECNRVDFGKEVLGMTVTGCGGEAVQLVCHSHHDLKIWHLSQVESVFASINSHTVALRRVELPGLSRIMATSEDGSVRLISSASGEVITIFFPVFAANVMRDVVYCPLGGMLFALLTTGEVLVVSAHTNPCSTLQLWTSRQRESIKSICACMVELRGETHSLLFGGGSLGYISLLHSSRFTMETSCPAHGGSVDKLVSPDTPVHLTDNSTSATAATTPPCLLSLGSDSFLNVWSLVVNERGDGVVLKMEICIQMESVPRHIGLVGRLLCLTTTSHRVKMLWISPEAKAVYHQSRHLSLHGCIFNSLPILHHQREDDHTDTITSLSSCPSLCLFATTSRDGHLKVWSSANQLVSEIFFGDSLVSACFSSARGDLLVGFQRQICRVASSHYLPSSYLSHSLECHSTSRCDDDRPIPFDPTLEFWYDPEHVPAYPVQLEERRKQCCLLRDYYTRPSDDTSHMKGGGGEGGERGGGVAIGASGIVDVRIARSSSHCLEASLVPSTTGVTDGLHPCESASSKGSSLSSLEAAILSGLGAMRSQELLRALVDKKKSYPHTQRPTKRFPAEVLPLQSPSSKTPIAPDCHIPNSTIRDTIGYVPSPDPLDLILQQQKLAKAIDHLLPTSPDAKPRRRLYRRKKRLSQQSLSSTESCGGGDGGGDGCVDDELMVVHESSKSLEPGPEKSESVVPSDDDDTRGAEISESGVLLAPYDDDDGDEDGDDWRSLSYLSKPVLKVSSVISHPPLASSDVVSDVCSPPCLERSSSSVVDDHKKAKNEPSIAKKESEVVLSHVPRDAPLPRADPDLSKVVPTVTIPFHTGPPPQTTTASTTTTNTDAVSGRGAVDKSENHQVSGGTDAEDEDGDLQRVMRMAAFPSSLRRNTRTVEGVCDGIVSMLGSVDAECIGDIGTVIVELKRVAELSEAQQSRMAEVLVSRLTSGAVGSHGSRQALLVALEKLGLAAAADSTLLAILPSLLDPNLEVRKCAFSALKTIAGISNRSELHSKLIQMGILQHIESNEDEILKSLSRRLKGRSSETGNEEKCLQPHPRVAIVRGDTREAGADGGCGISHGGKSRAAEFLRPPHIHGAPHHHHHHQQKKNQQRPSTREASSGQPRGPTSTTRASQRRSSGSQRGGGLYHRQEMAIFQERLGLQPTLAFISATDTRLRRELEKSGVTGAGAGCCRLSATSTGWSGVSEVKRLQRLLAARPATFSQSGPIRDAMMRAYYTTTTGAEEAGREPTAVVERGREGRRKRHKEHDFKWTEVFPVIRGSQREVDEVGMAGEKKPGPSRHKDVELKLPKIMHI